VSDEDLRELERRATVDAGAALRFARALARSGDTTRAARELARVVEQSPSDADALVELDRLTRGGVDPSAPWPGERGDGRGSRRSRATGPARGGQVGRVRFDIDGMSRPIAIDASTRVIVGGGWDPHHFVIDQEGARPVWRSARGDPLLLPGTLVGIARTKERAFVQVIDPPRGISDLQVPCVVGLGHAVFAKGKQGIEARQLPSRDAPLRWAAPIPRSPADIVFGPGALVLVLTTSGLGARGSFHRFELASGRALPPVSLERLGSVDGKIVAGEDGTVYLGLGGSTVALDPEGKEKWRHESSGTLVALAGESADIVVVSEPQSLAPFAIDARTGKELWRSRDACLNGTPKIDATGRIFWRREQELVAFEPRTGKIVYQALVGGGYWEFAFDGKGHTLALCHGTRELVILE
jgi:hypothetical protein